MSESQEKSRYLLTGGGTGGHVYPAIAIADEIKREDAQAEFLYVGVKGKAEEEIVPKRGYPLVFVNSRGFPGTKPSLSLVLFAISLTLGFLKAGVILLRFRPHVIIATGGYVSAPIMLAWIVLKKLGILKAEAIVHEQNLVPGRLNQLVGKLASRVIVSFEDSLKYFSNAEYHGYPIRSEISEKRVKNPREKLGIPEDAKVVMAFGGSMGARTINRAMIDALPFLLKDPNVWVIHETGKQSSSGSNAKQGSKERLKERSLSEEDRKRYIVEQYLDTIENYYHSADLIVCRAGAGTLSEVSICGLPTLFIPKANLPGDHQVQNARILTRNNAAAMLYERTEKQQEGLLEVIHGEDLATEIFRILGDDELRRSYSEKIRDFGNKDSLKETAEKIASFRKGNVPPIEKKTILRSDEVDFSKLTGGGLVSHLTRHGYQHLSDDDYEYLTYRMYGYLASNAWQTRNIGVKLVGLLNHVAELPLLIYLLQDKTPAPFVHRMLGGDRKQVGFIRRNILTSFLQCNVWDQEIENAVLESLQDPYFEVRSKACYLVEKFQSQLQREQDVLESLKQCIQERNFEVVSAAIRALGSIEKDKAFFKVLQSFYKHPNWKVRAAVLDALAKLVERGILDADYVKQDLDEVLMTSSGFVPSFSIRKEMLKLSQALEK